MSLGKRRILVADDDHECRLLLSSLMSQAGFVVDAVPDGMMALTIVRSRPPDLVLLATKLPHMDGFEVCRAIKADAATARIPVVFVAEAAVRPRSIEAGADELVEKPVSREAILELVHQLLHIRDVQEHLDVGAGAMVEGLAGGSSMPRP